MEPARSHSDGPPPPAHVAIIMDGNGRWAKARGLPRIEGHRRGAESVRATVRAAVDLGISHLTLFGFSTENWKRPEGEVNDLMGLLRLYLKREVAELKRNNVRIRFIGDRSVLASDITSLMEEAETTTAGNTALTLVIALSYGSRMEITLAARGLAEDVAAGRLKPDEIDERAFADRLFTADIPDPDLLIRTSGEQRISNFLLWQLAYAELVFTDTLWPDFSKEDLEAAVGEFLGRDRRYGGVAV